MYFITCGNSTLYNPLNSELVLGSPKLTLEVNKAGSLSFSIYPTHKHYNDIQKMRSIITVKQDNSVIFRGRVLSDKSNFYKVKTIKVEGLLACFNDSIVRNYEFEGAVDEYLAFLINQHNDQVEEFQRFKLGTVTVTDPNDYITRANSNYPTTWEEIEAKLIKLLGGYFCIRYEDDGNYIDYLSELILTNTQPIKFAYNLLDLNEEYSADETYSVMVPRGAEIESEDGVKSVVMITDLPDGDIGEDIVKDGDEIYSKSAVAKYGRIYAPSSVSTWQDVTTAGALLNKSIDRLTGEGQLLKNTIDITAVDLHFSDEQIQTFRVGRNVIFTSTPHGKDETYPLIKLDIPISDPQNTKISIGKTVLTLTDNMVSNEHSTAERLETAEKDIAENRNEVNVVRNEVITRTTEIINNCNEIIMSALESYVQTGDYEQFKSTVQSRLELLPGEMLLYFEQNSQTIKDINGDLQSVNEKLAKHFEFGVDGLTIKAGENVMQILIDNDLITFTKNGQQFGWWDGVDFHTGNIIVDLEEKAQFGNFAFVPRSDGSLSLLKVGG